jgi:hypothetical protein
MRISEMSLVVFSAEGGKPRSVEEQGRYELHRELSGLSSYGAHRILAGTTNGSLVTIRAHAAQVATRE